MTNRPTWEYLIPPAMLAFSYATDWNPFCIFTAGMWTSLLIAWHLNWRKTPRRVTEQQRTLAEKRKALSRQLDGVTFDERVAILESIDPDLYASWMQDPYPGRGDNL